MTDTPKQGFSLPDPRDLPKKAPSSTPKQPPKQPPTSYPGDRRKTLRHGLTAGSLPHEMKYIERQTNEFRRFLEDRVLEAKGEICLTDASCINTAVKWERHGLLAVRWLRVEGHKMSHSDLLKFSAETARASDNRDKAIAKLELDAPPEPVRLVDYLEQAQ